MLFESTSFRAQLSKELDATKKRHFAEQEQIDGLSQTMQKIEASQVNKET